MAQFDINPVKIGNLSINIVNLYSLVPCTEISYIGHFHEFFEIHIVFNGFAKIKAGNEIYELQKNSFIIFPPDFVHGLSSVSDDYQVLCIAFEFKPLDLSTQKKYEYAFFYNIFSRENIKLSQMNEEELRTIQQLLNHTNKFTMYDINKVTITAANFFLDMANRLYLENSVTKDENPIISSNEISVRKYKIERFVQSYLDNPRELSLDALAEHLFLSPRQTERFIKTIFGLTFKQVCTKYRMAKAQTLILEGKLSIEEIAYQTGFNSYSGFLSAYKKYYGYSPKHKK